MPTVNIYFRKEDEHNKFQEVVNDLRKFLATKLSVDNFVLSPEEISVRLIKTEDGSEMIGSIEIEITAHNFPDRIKKQDEICLDVVKYLKEEMGDVDVKVWLKLLELGHSW